MIRTSDTLDGDFITTVYNDAAGVCVRASEHGSVGSHGFLILDEVEFNCHNEGWFLDNSVCSILIARPVIV